MIKLVYNELLKVIRKKRILVIVLILLVLIPIFTYGQYRTAQETIKQLGTSDWRAMLQQQIVDQQNRLSSSRMPEERKEWIKLIIQQQQYYLDHNINPTAPGAPTFIREFVDQAVALFLPLLVVVLAADIVSSEHSGGTIKLLLTRPVRRWKILLSKYFALLLSVSLMVVLTAVLGYLISGVLFGYKGWTLPVFTGFQEKGGQLVTENIHLIPQWKYILMAYGLAWFTCIAVGTISFMVSVLVRSTAASMGIMLAAVISGSLLGQLAPNWNELKYLAFTNLSLTDYLSGQPILVEGMTLPFSLAILSIWSVSALVIAFVVFSRRDVLA
ncbi:ABC transporter permease [Paenactinomyces guangxiensis]|uniref:ABC transporter permease n=1 Tax=Paenactinomyces guangxiensis TaxID=1490290 RepID=A0A7W1WTV8_9BACL|nr:ABC transporter permease [Paenactinomyces guangxiensis]MBA4495776.1 ABC transporter permease [Paenactinomyces guangxiensis]MBH8592765.1 ABC transporter permease [Paenactinomyces guangxiensis]